MAIPADATTFDGFLDWYSSDDFPRSLRASFINGSIWLEPMADEPFSHNALKTAVAAALREYGRRTGRGRAYSDGVLYGHRPTGPANEADATFLLFDSLRSGRVRIDVRFPGAGGPQIVQGSADLLVECVSQSSVGKDTVQLRAAYLAAGVREYWILDGRGDELGFDLLTRDDDADEWIEAVPGPDGSRYSPLLERHVRVDRETDPVGDLDWDVVLNEPAA